MALAERAACDVRSCLNTLQFLARQGTRVRTQDITSLNMGQKDISTGAFTVWSRLLSSKARFCPAETYEGCMKFQKQIHCSETISSLLCKKRSCMPLK